MKLGEFLFACERDIGYITSRAGLAAKAFTKIISNDEVKARASFCFCAGRTILQVNPVEHLNQIEDANLDSGLCQQFASNAFFQTLADFHAAARDRPFTAQ